MTTPNAWPSAVDLINQCLAAGICEFIVCAGARNAALIEALSHAESAGHIRLWSHFEERSAGFFALGRTMATSAPCAVVTTSGTAAAELLPAVIEAHYQARPLVAITADRPASFRNTGAPQAIDQIGIFGPHAYNGPIASWSGAEPIHINPEFPEEFSVAPCTFQPAQAFVRRKEKLDVSQLARWLRTDLYKGLVVMIGGLEPEEQEEVYHFCRQLGAPIVAEANSGLRESLEGLSIHNPDPTLATKPPGKVLRLGDVPSGRFWRDLEDLPETSVWSICRNGKPGLARASQVTQGSLARVLPALGEIDPTDDALDLLYSAGSRAGRIDELLEAYPDSEPGLIRTISHYAALSQAVFLGNSMPIRQWNQFAQWNVAHPNIRANRGTNGIDGQISTWLGWTVDTPNTWAILGDLTTLYDLAAPFILPQFANNSRVLVVINNQGGQIFSRVPRLQQLTPRAKECMTSTHQANLAGFANLWNMQHIQIRTIDDFDQFEPDTKPTLLEIIPDPKQTDAFWMALK